MVALVAFTAPLATVNLTVAGLGAGTSGRTWILSSMSIGLGAFLLTAGRVADDFGRRRTFVAGALGPRRRLRARPRSLPRSSPSWSPAWSRASGQRR